MPERDRIPVMTFEGLRRVCAELALVIKYLSERGHPCDAPFNVLCALFSPLIRKIAVVISRRHHLSYDEIEQEVQATLFELTLNFDWDRCVDGNLFALYVKRCLFYVTDFRINRAHRDLPTPEAIPEELYLNAEPVVAIPLNSILKIVETRKGTKASDLLFCLFSLQMSQADAGRVFGAPQVTLSRWWRDMIPELRDIVKEFPTLRSEALEVLHEFPVERVSVSFVTALSAAEEVRDLLDGFSVIGSEVVDRIKASGSPRE